MSSDNCTSVTDFILLGLTDRPELQGFLFVFFLIIYFFTLLGNLGLIVVILLNSSLHTPMYFFLTNLAFVDLWYSSNATPKMLANFLSEKKTISFAGCFIQCYIFIALLLTEYYMLAAMAYDRYMAICHPLHYSIKMSRRVCTCLITFPYVYGFSDGLFQAVTTFRLSFCGSNVINHFYCADPPLLKLSNSDTHFKENAIKMPSDNCTSVTDFILVGLTDRPESQGFLFVFFLIIYFFTLLGNLGLIVLILLNSSLHMPMYFFLTNLAFVDLWCSTTTTPKMLTNFLSEKKTISFVGCFIQCYIFIALSLTEFYILAAMAYDRYMAICHPLHYSIKMTRRVYTGLIAFPYVYGFSEGLFQTITTFRLSFCGSNVINHFFCTDPPLMKLSRSDTHLKEYAMLLSAGFNLFNSFTIIILSYIFILTAILKIQSSEGRSKAFSTCGSHIMGVTLFYGSMFCMYVRPLKDQSMGQSKVVSVFYTFVCPMLNPLIYSLRNKDVKAALRKLVNERGSDQNQMMWADYIQVVNVNTPTNTSPEQTDFPSNTTALLIQSQLWSFRTEGIYIPENEVAAKKAAAITA
ncbi:olfactory receptor 5M11-like [Tachyglossus aculeatus]|uniref:olfactory receptor 5M11-like n=1 Tax=Tachyglossus aculeatus TaxID=9261 RepID=UPI0018F43BCF|nr:olfactory receptor 5M11-like [Tachyglossus aculeatus]